MAAATLPRPYYRILGASGLSNLADGIRMAAFPLLAASLTNDATLVAMVFVAGEAPWVVFGFLAGKLADQVDRRRLVSAVTMARTVLLLGLAALILVNSAPLWLVTLAAFVLGSAEVLADTTSGTLVPSVVHPDQLERANSRMVAAQIAGNELIGPAIGGVLFAVGAALPFFANGSLLAVALILLAGLPILQPTNPEPEQPVQQKPPRAFDGIAFVRARPILQTITWTSALLAAVDAAWFSLLVLFVRQQLGFGPMGFGISLAIGAVGGLAGAALADRCPNSSLIRVTVVAYLSTAVSLIALGIAPTVVVTMVALIITSAVFAVWNVHIVSARQRATPNHMLGRVGATFRTVVVMASMLGALAGGLLADLASIRGALVGYGVILLVATPFAVLALRAVTPSSDRLA